MRALEEEKGVEDEGDEPEKLKKMLVLDSRAFFLRKISVEALTTDRPGAETDVEFSTCQDVIHELKDEQTRTYVETLPLELELLEPAEAAVKFVTKFAKETGDYQSLSGTDLRVIALAYSIVKDRNEAHMCRKSPPEISEFKPKWAKPPSKQKKKAEPAPAEEDDEWEVVEKKENKGGRKFKRNIKRDFYPQEFLNKVNNDTAAQNGTSEQPEEKPEEATEPTSTFEKPTESIEEPQDEEEAQNTNEDECEETAED
jgi:hypothetical protein